MDARVTHIIPNREVDVTGIDNHEMNSLKIVNATAKVITQRGPVVLILNQYAYHGMSRTIHSSGQIEAYGNRVDDRSLKAGGKQCIRTLDGYIIPIDIINGLPYIKMVPNTDQDLQDLPSIVLTSAVPGNPSPSTALFLTPMIGITISSNFRMVSLRLLLTNMVIISVANLPLLALNHRQSLMTPRNTKAT